MCYHCFYYFYWLLGHLRCEQNRFACLIKSRESDNGCDTLRFVGKFWLYSERVQSTVYIRCLQSYADYRRTIHHFSWINPNKSNSSNFIHLSFNIQMELDWEWKQERGSKNWWIVDVTYKDAFNLPTKFGIWCLRAQYKLIIIIIEPSTLSFSQLTTIE